MNFNVLYFKRSPYDNDFWPISLYLNIILDAWNGFSGNWRESCDRLFFLNQYFWKNGFWSCDWSGYSKFFCLECGFQWWLIFVLFAIYLIFVFVFILLFLLNPYSRNAEGILFSLETEYKFNVFVRSVYVQFILCPGITFSLAIFLLIFM